MGTRVWRFLVAGALLIAASSGLRAQQDNPSRALAGLNVSPELQPTKTMFLEIDACRVKIPEGQLQREFTQVEESLAAGLLIGWSPGWLKKSPQPHYVNLQSVLVDFNVRKPAA